MYIILGIIIAVIIAVIAYAIGAINSSESLPNCCLTCLHEHNHNFGVFTPYCCDHYGIGSMRVKMETQERMIWEMKREIELNLKQKINPMFYAKSIKEQEYIDIITQGAKSAEKLSKELYESIK